VEGYGCIPCHSGGLTLGHKRALQVPKIPIRLCLLDGRGGCHLPCVVATAIGATRPSAPEVWPPDSSSFAGASVGVGIIIIIITNFTL